MTKRILVAAVAACTLVAASSADARPAPAEARALAQRIVAQLNAAPPADGSAWGVPSSAEWYDAGWLRLASDSDTLAEAHHVAPPLEASDPLCGCEHPSFRYRVGAMNLRAGGVVSFQMRVNNGSAWSSHEVQLRRVGGHWRIWNVVDDMGDWRAYLTRFNACVRRATTDAAAQRCGAGDR